MNISYKRQLLLHHTSLMGLLGRVWGMVELLGLLNQYNRQDHGSGQDFPHYKDSCQTGKCTF